MEEPQENQESMLDMPPLAKITFTTSIRELVQNSRAIRYELPLPKGGEAQMRAQANERKRKRTMRFERLFNPKIIILDADTSDSDEKIPSLSNGTYVDGRQNLEKGDETSQENIPKEIPNMP